VGTIPEHGLEAEIARALAAGDRAAELRPRLERAIRARGAATTRLEELGRPPAALVRWGRIARERNDARAALDRARSEEDAARRELEGAEALARRRPELERELAARRVAEGGAGAAVGREIADAERQAAAFRVREAELEHLERDLREAVDALEAGRPSREAALARAREALARARGRSAASELPIPSPDGDAGSLAHAVRTAYHRAGELRQLAIADGDRASRARDAGVGRLLGGGRAP